MPWCVEAIFLSLILFQSKPFQYSLNARVFLKPLLFIIGIERIPKII